MFSKSYFPGIYFNSVLQLGKAHQNSFEIFFLKLFYGDKSHISYNLPIKVKFQYTHCCLSITTINFRTYLLLQKKIHTHYPFHHPQSSCMCSPRQPLIQFCLYRFACSGHFLLMEACNIWPFVSDLYLAKCFYEFMFLDIG